GGCAPDKLRRSDVVLGLVRAFDEARKPIAFICHAGWVPISAKILNGRRATSVAAIRDDMVNAGADWVDEAAVVDGNLISARTGAGLGHWTKGLLAALGIPGTWGGRLVRGTVSHANGAGARKPHASAPAPPLTRCAIRTSGSPSTKFRR